MSKPAEQILSFYASFLSLKRIWGTVLCIIIIINIFNFNHSLRTSHLKRKLNPYLFYGFIFSGLENVLKDVERVGYYTDRDTALDETAARFAQAQYILAPLIVDLNFADHEFILFDCTSEKTAMTFIESIGAIPIKKNKFGIILAQQKK